MYVRDAKNREEVWLLDHIEDMGLDDTSFRSRDYVIAIDEETNEKAGFGRIRIHKRENGPDVDEQSSSARQTASGEVCELTSIGVLPEWRGQGVGAHVIERLIGQASDQGFEDVYALVGEHEYLAQFGFKAIDTDDLPEKLQERLAEKREETEPDAIPMRLAVEEFTVPDRLREAFKTAEAEAEPEPTESAEDFGIDPEKATYKYSTK